MVNGCVIIGCANGALKGKYSDKNVSMHAFPLDDQELCEKWVKAIRRQNFVPSKHSRLCSSHFQPSDLIEHSADTNVSRQRQHKDRKLAKRYLRKGAIPSIFPDMPHGSAVYGSQASNFEAESKSRIDDTESLHQASTSSPPRSESQISFIVDQDMYSDEPTDLSMKTLNALQELSSRPENGSSERSNSFYLKREPEYEQWIQTEPLDLSISRPRSQDWRSRALQVSLTTEQRKNRVTRASSIFCCWHV